MGRFGGLKILLTLASFAFCATAWADCTSPAATIGKIEYNTTKSTFEYCDGTNWIDMKKGGSTDILASLTDTTPRISSPNGVAIYGNYAYVANPGADSIAVLDITNVNSPSILTHLINSTLLSNPTDIFISGTYLYALNGTTLVVIDISAPATPTIVGSVTDATNLPSANQIFVSGGYAYISINNGLSIFNVSTPSSPAFSGKIVDATNLGGARGVYTVGNYAYVAAYNSDRLTVVNVTNKSAPTVQGSVQSTTDYLNGAYGVYVSGNYAFVTGSLGDDLAVVDVSNPSSPAITGGILENGITGWDGPKDICVSGNTMFIVNDADSTTNSYITSVDFSSPTTPRILSYRTLSATDISFCAESSGRFIATGSSTHEIFTADSTAKQVVTPTLASSINDPGSGRMLAGAVSGNYLYTIAEKQTGTGYYFLVYNIGTPTNLSVAAKLEHANLSTSCEGIAISGSYAYVVCDSKMLVFNITTPTSPTYVTMLSDATNLLDARKVFISGSYAYITTGSSTRLTIVNISTPSSPSVTGSLQDATYLNNNCAKASGVFCGGLVVSGNYAYVAAYNSDSLTIVDISVPSAPAITGTYQSTPNLDNVTDVKISGSYAFLTTLSDRLTSINISTPSSPTLGSSLTSNVTDASGLVISGSYAYVANKYNPGAIRAYNISNPAAMSYSGGSSGNGYIPINVVLSGTYIFAVDYLYLASYDISSPGSPVFRSKTQYAGATSNFKSVDISSSGNYAFAVGRTLSVSDVALFEPKINVFDITNKTTPSLIATVTDNTNLTDPEFADESGGYLYVVDSYDDSLVIYNVSTPSSPTYSGKYVSSTYLDGADHVTVVGNYAYVAAFTSDRLTIIDITNKASPTLAGSIQDTVNLDGATHVFISGNYAYVTSYTSAKLTVVNISNKSSPTIVGTFSDTSLFTSPRAVSVIGNYAYVYASLGGYNGVVTMDITTPANPTYVSLVSTSNGSSSELDVVGSSSLMTFTSLVINQYYTSDPTNVELLVSVNISQCGSSIYSDNGRYGGQAGSYMLVYRDNAQALCIYQMTTTPIATGVKTLVDGNRIAGSGLVEVAGSYAFVVSDMQYLTAINISNPLAPTIASSVYLSGVTNPSSIDINGSYAYITESSSSTPMMAVVNISNPLSMQVVAMSSISASTTDVHINGSYAYILDQSDRIAIKDISNPLAPTTVSSTIFNAVMDYPREVIVSGNYAYVACSTNSSLMVLDVTNKTSVTQAASLVDTTNLSGARAIAISGNYAYVGGSTKLAIVDITTPTAPTVVGAININLGALTVRVVGTTAYTSGSGGIAMIDISNPTSPTLLDITSPFFNDLSISGDYGFAVGTNTFNVFDARPAVTNGACTSIGTINYNTTSNVLEFCDGSIWKVMGNMPGAGGTGCTSPTGAKGALDFYSTTNRYRYCDGTNWITID